MRSVRGPGAQVRDLEARLLVAIHHEGIGAEVADAVAVDAADRAVLAMVHEHLEADAAQFVATHHDARIDGKIGPRLDSEIEVAELVVADEIRARLRARHLAAVDHAVLNLPHATVF